jgi:hypothetical protein
MNRFAKKGLVALSSYFTTLEEADRSELKPAHYQRLMWKSGAFPLESALFIA